MSDDIERQRVECWISNASDPLSVQIGGGHYKDMKIQPVEFIHANGLGFLEGCIIKRICRWRNKDGFKDLEKIKHEVDLLIQMERHAGSAQLTNDGASLNCEEETHL